MKRLIPAILLAFFMCFKLYGQSDKEISPTEEKAKFIRVSSDLLFDRYELLYQDAGGTWRTRAESEVTFGNIAPSYEIQQNRRIQKFEMNNFRIYKSSFVESKAFNVMLSPLYEIDYLLIKPEAKRLLPYAGAKFDLNTQYQKASFENSTINHDQNGILLDLDVFLTVGSRLNLGNRFNLDMQIPLSLYSIVFRHIKYNDKLNSGQEMAWADSDLIAEMPPLTNFFQDFRFKIGIGYKLVPNE